jgi:hypothetical protein
VIHGISLLGWLSGPRGFWQYLSVRAVARAEVEKARIALEKDRERNHAVAGYIAQLPEWAELADYEDSTGRKIWIRKGGCGQQCPRPASLGLTAASVDAAPITEIAGAEHGPTKQTPP